MTKDQIMALPTITDLSNFQHSKIATAQADGTYNYDILQIIIAERDQIVARETVGYHSSDGDERWETIYGTATERFAKRQRFVREQEQIDGIARYTRATKDRI